MKTLLLAPELFTTDSGIPRILRLYLKALCDVAKPEDRVDVVTLNDAEIPEASLIRYARQDALGETVACAQNKLRFIREVLRLARRADLVICGHVAQLPVAWLAGLVNSRLRYALVAHGIEVWRPFSFFERRALRGAWRVFCVSEFTRRELTARVKLSAGVAVVLPNALDPALEQNTGPAQASDAPETARATNPVILCVSRLSFSDRYKGIDHLIAAMPVILKTVSSATLRIVGRGDDLARLQALATQLAIGDAVRFLGFLDDAQLRAEFARCTAFALPSEKEGFGLVYVEAMTHGKPCIAAAAGGAPEVVSPESGLLVPYGNVPALAKACASALETKWDPETVRTCASRFSYAVFREKLKCLITA